MDTSKGDLEIFNKITFAERLAERSTRVLFFLLGFFLGVILASFGQFIFLFIIIFLLCFGAFLLRKKLFFQLVVVVVAGMVGGFFRYWLDLPNFTPGDIGFYRDLQQELHMRGYIAGEVDVRDDRQYVTIEIQELWVSGQWKEVRGKVLLKTQKYPEFFYGQMLDVVGRLESPPRFEKFSYADVLAKEDIYVVCYTPKIRVVRSADIFSPRADPFWNLVFDLKGIFARRINELFTEPEASLVAGLLLGLRRSISPTVLDDFNQTGLTHVLAISGYNINLMIAVFGTFFVGVGRRTRFFGMLGGIFLFLLFTGFSGSVIRAAWMGFFLLLSTVNGRKGRGFFNLLLSGFMMTLLKPRVLVFDISFQLSFLATLGLVLCMPFFEKLLAKWPKLLAEGLAVTLAAQVFTTPFILYYFGRFSLISPLTNILFLPLIPFIMFFSFAALVFSFIGLPGTFFWTAFTWVFVEVLLNGVHFFALLPFASI